MKNKHPCLEQESILASTALSVASSEVEQSVAGDGVMSDKVQANPEPGVQESGHKAGVNKNLKTYYLDNGVF